MSGKRSFTVSSFRIQSRTPYLWRQMSCLINHFSPQTLRKARSIVWLAYYPHPFVFTFTFFLLTLAANFECFSVLLGHLQQEPTTA